jgi:outer membrane protein assembly factor BamE (lipoprotein component of BamABCDE complex)
MAKRKHLLNLSLPGRGLRGLAAGVLALTLLGACDPRVNVRGNTPDPELVEEIQPGSSTRNDVVRLLGTPSTLSTFRDNTWYYMGHRSEELAFFKPEILERSVLVVNFDASGTVTETKLYQLEDGAEVDPVDRVTPTEGREMTVMQQLFGNIGRYPGSSN